MKYYLIEKINGSLLADGSLLQGENSKTVLESFLGKKVIRSEKNPEYSVIESNEKGQYHYDRRKWVYYKIK